MTWTDAALLLTIAVIVGALVLIAREGANAWRTVRHERQMDELLAFAQRHHKRRRPKVDPRIQRRRHG